MYQALPGLSSPCLHTGSNQILEGSQDLGMKLTQINVIVIAQVPGIYGSKQTESKGVARGRGLFTTAINPWPPVL